MDGSFFDLAPRCFRALDDPLLGAALEQESLLVQVFKLSHLKYPTLTTRDLFRRIEDTSAFTADHRPYTGFPSLLARFGVDLYCFGNIALMTDFSRPKQPCFRLITPDYRNRDRHGCRFDDVPPRCSIELFPRSKRLDNDPEYGEPYLGEALPLYDKMLEAWEMDMQSLESSSFLLRGDPQFPRQKPIKAAFLEKAGFSWDDKMGIPHIQRSVAHSLASEVKEIFLRGVLIPYQKATNSPEIPEIVVPKLFGDNNGNRTK